MKHGDEETHFVCDEVLARDGGKSLCCGCTKHECLSPKEECTCQREEGHARSCALYVEVPFDSHPTSWENDFYEVLPIVCSNLTDDSKVSAIKKVFEKLLSRTREEAVKEYREREKEIVEKVKRIKLDMDTVVCDCGEPYKDSDPAILVNELLSLLQALDEK